MAIEMVTLQGEPVACLQYLSKQHKADAILIHGFTGSKEDFDPLGALLAERGYRVVTFDNRGQHESPHSHRPDAYSVDSLARDVVELVDTLNLHTPHLFGHSLGGVIAQRAVVQAPNRFRSLTLMCSGPEARKDPPFPMLVKEKFASKSMQDIWIEFLDKDLQTHLRYQLMKKRWLASDHRSLMTHADELMNFSNIIEKVADTHLPAHVLFGENDDAWPHKVQREMARALGAEVNVIADAGHCPNEDQPERTAKVVADFWDKN